MLAHALEVQFADCRAVPCTVLAAHGVGTHCLAGSTSGAAGGVHMLLDLARRAGLYALD